MTIKPLQLMALVVAASWLGVSPTRGQQFQPYPPQGMAAYQPVAAPMGPPGASPYGPYASGAHLAAYQQAVEAPPYYEQVPAGTPQMGAMPGYQDMSGYAGPGYMMGEVPSDGYAVPYQPAGYMPHGDMAEAPPLYSPCCPTGAPILLATRAEVMVMGRNVSDLRNFTSQGVSGPIVLSTENLDFEFQAGIRTFVTMPICQYMNLEASYFGLNQWSDQAAVTDPSRNLFSVYSDFGNRSTVIVINGQNININQNALDGSSIQSIAYHSELHNAELNLQGQFKLRSPKQELWLQAGARFTKVLEDFQYLTQVTGAVNNELVGESFTEVETDNNLVGFQLGAILNHCVTPKLRFTFDAKTAMMVNFAEQESVVNANLVVLGLPINLGDERVRDESIALITDAGASLTYDITGWMSVTGGYRVFYVDGLALAPENFNPVLPIPGTAFRTPMINTNGNVLYHGANAGLEVRW